MTEAEWLACDDPDMMLDFLFGKSSPRKLRLFGVACCRRIWHILTDERSRAAVDLVEKLADGGATNWERCEAAQETDAAADAAGGGPALAAHDLAGEEGYQSAVVASRRAAGVVADASDDDSRAKAESEAQATTLRDIFGPLPFHPVSIDPAWLRWNDGTVPAIARRIYDDRRWEDIPILADALQDAGCENADILDHCRKPVEHVRGCWVVDLLLGKG